MLKFPSDQTISLRIINEKQGSTTGEIHSNLNLRPKITFMSIDGQLEEVIQFKNDLVRLLFKLILISAV